MKAENVTTRKIIGIPMKYGTFTVFPSANREIKYPIIEYGIANPNM